MYLDYIIFQMHPLFNESKKTKVVYKCDRRKTSLTFSYFKL